MGEFVTNSFSVSVCCIVRLTVLHEIDPKDITCNLLRQLPPVWKVANRMRRDKRHPGHLEQRRSQHRCRLLLPPNFRSLDHQDKRQSQPPDSHAVQQRGQRQHPLYTARRGISADE